MRSNRLDDYLPELEDIDFPDYSPGRRLDNYILPPIDSDPRRIPPRRPMFPIWRWWWIIIGIIIIFIVFLLIEGSVAGDDLVKIYVSLTAKVNDSTINFDKRLSFVSTDSDGTVNIEFGWKNEYTKSTGEVASAWAENNPGETNPSLSESGSSVQLSADAETIKQALINGGYSEVKATGMATAYDIINPTLGTNAAIGLMANIAEEGDFGVVEESYSRSASSIFPGSAYHRTCVSVDGLDWLENKGDGVSCGFGCVQWSYGRRMALVSVYRSIISGSSISDSERATAEAMFMGQELSPGSSYYNSVSRHVTNDTAEEWAEAFNDYYEISGGSCYGEGHPKMSGGGSSCVRRRRNATNIASILSGL